MSPWKKVTPKVEQILPEIPQIVQPIQKSNVEELRKQIRELEKTDLSPIIPESTKERIVVVREIPNNKVENPDGSITFKSVRTIKDKDGTIVHFWTIEEALTEMLNED